MYAIEGSSFDSNWTVQVRVASRLLQLGLFYMIGACTGVVVANPNGRVPGDPTRPGVPRATGAGTTGPNMRYVCRGATPSGWIAIDYIEDTESCATSKRRYNSAVIVPLANTQVGQSLEVCADERVPTNWYVMRNIVDAGRCPSDKPQYPSAPISTVREIRRDR